MKNLTFIIPLLIIVTGIAAFFALKNKPTQTPPITPTPSTLTQTQTPSPTPLPLNFKILSGSATIQHNSDTTNLTAPNSKSIEPNDKISTNDKSLGILEYSESTSVALGPNTSVQASSKTSLDQFLGSIYVRFKRILGVQEEFSVNTNSVTATVRGTAFASFVNKTQTKIKVTKDTVELKNDTGIKDIPENKSAEISSPNGNINTSKVTFTSDETNWITLNQKADANPEILEPEFKKLFINLPTPTPTKKPTPTPQPISYATSMPGEGYSKSIVKTDSGDFPLSCVGANSNSTRVITDSGNDSDCKDNCTVLPLSDYATRNGGYAAMNGTYFCPADYASCQGKTNSFDTLFFNSRTKTYINSDNNIYSVLPFLVIEASGNPRFITKTQEWGRDTSIQAGIAGNPLLTRGGVQVATESGLDEKQKTVKSNRGAFVQEGNNHYLCIVGNATVLDSAKVYSTLGADNAINIDGGGSSALWLNGKYLYGPGRSIPNAIVLVKK